MMTATARRPTPTYVTRLASVVARSVSSSAVEQDRDRAVVHQLDLHVLLEGAAANREPVHFERAGERLDSFAGDLRIGRRVPRRPAPSTRVSVEGELGHDQDLAAGVLDRAVHLPLLVLEDPKGRDLRREPCLLAVHVGPPDADQDEEAGADLRDDLVCATYGRAGDALQHQ